MAEIYYKVVFYCFRLQFIQQKKKIVWKMNSSATNESSCLNRICLLEHEYYDILFKHIPTTSKIVVNNINWTPSPSPHKKVDSFFRGRTVVNFVLLFRFDIIKYGRWKRITCQTCVRIDVVEKKNCKIHGRKSLYTLPLRRDYAPFSSHFRRR